MSRKIGIVGFGNQAKAWAQNLKESGWLPTVLLRPKSGSNDEARSLGLSTADLGPKLKSFPILAILIPDDAMPLFFRKYGQHISAGQSLVFAHGFNLHFKTVPWPKSVDWILVAPKGIGTAVRERYLAGSGVPAVLAVENDATGRAWRTANLVARGIGADRAGVYQATAREEVEADLFSEQALLCGGLPALVALTYDVLVKAGIRPEVAYLECVHELGYMADLIQKRGIYETLRFASPTARFGGFQGAHRIVTGSLRTELESLLERIRSGAFTRELGEEASRGYPKTRGEMKGLKGSSVETVGRKVRDRVFSNPETLR